MNGMGGATWDEFLMSCDEKMRRWIDEQRENNARRAVMSERFHTPGVIGPANRLQGLLTDMAMAAEIGRDRPVPPRRKPEGEAMRKEDV